MSIYINGTKVEEKQVAREMERMRSEYERIFAQMPADERETQLRQWAQENVIETLLMHQAALREFPDIPDSQVQELFENLIKEHGGKSEFFNRTGLKPEQESEIRDDLANQIRREKLMEIVRAKAAQPTEKEIRRYYEKHQDRFTIPEQIRAAHIVRHPCPEVHSDEQKQELEEVRRQLEAGADFNQLAADHSDCPENGGDLGYFTRGRMVENFEQAVFPLQAGQFSGVFATEFGWHIAKVLDRRPAMPCPLEQVREVIVRELEEQNRQKAFEDYVDAERQKARIEEK